MNMHSTAPAAIGVVGATGYTGRELLRILAGHGDVDVVFATSESQAGEPSGLPGLDLVTSATAPLDGVDLVFLCLPHGASAGWAERALGAGVRVVDLTADHRPGSGREEGAVYGMADLLDRSLVDATLVANPGCYATGAHLALHPLARAGLVRTDQPVVINAASGVTGAGRSPKRELLFAEVAGDFKAYSLGNEHRHLREMRAELPDLQLIFQPHLLPVARGILETIYLPVPSGVGAASVRAAWAQAYANAPTIEVLSEGIPSLADVVGTDRLALGVSENAGVASMLTLVVALDNLGKGAAGQAVHNMNLMLGMAPDRGLRC